MDDGLDHARSEDPGRGPFRATTKIGTPLNVPAKKRKAGATHIDKTYEDSLPVKERRRYKEWLARQGR